MSIYDRLKAANPSMSEEELRRMAANMSGMAQTTETIVEEEQKKKEEEEKIDEHIKTGTAPEEITDNYLTKLKKENKQVYDKIQSGQAALYMNDEGEVVSEVDLEKIAKNNNTTVAKLLEQNPQFQKQKSIKTDTNEDGIIDDNDEPLNQNIINKLKTLKGPDLLKENKLDEVEPNFGYNSLYKYGKAFFTDYTLEDKEQDEKEEAYKSKREEALLNVKSDAERQVLENMTDEEYINAQNQRKTRDFYNVDQQMPDIDGDIKRIRREETEKKIKEWDTKRDYYQEMEDNIAKLQELGESDPDGAGKDYELKIQKLIESQPDGGKAYNNYKEVIKPALANLFSVEDKNDGYMGFEAEDERIEYAENVTNMFLAEYGDDFEMMTKLAAGGSEGTISDVVKTGLEEKENILFDIRSKVLNQGVEDSRQAIQNIMNLPISNEEKQELIEKENEKGNQLMADLKFDAANNMFKNSFKNTDKLKEWKRSWDDNWFGRQAQSVLNLGEGIAKIPVDLFGGGANWAVQTVGDLTGLAGRTKEGGTMAENYNAFDFVDQAFNSFRNTEFVGTSDDPSYDMLDKDGNFNWGGVGNGVITKTVSDMLPFTLAIMNSVKKGNVKDAKNLMGKGWLAKRASDPNTYRMMKTAFNMTANDNRNEGKKLGLSGMQLAAFSTGKSIATAIVQPIMPDI